MSLRNFLLDKAGFDIIDLTNFLNFNNKKEIDEKFLNEKYLEIIEILSELTGIPMSQNEKLSKDSSDNFKFTMNDSEFQDKLTTKIISIRSEIGNNQISKIISDSAIKSKESFSSKEKSSNLTNNKINISASSIDNSNNNVDAIKSEPLKTTNTNTDIINHTNISSIENSAKKHSEFDFEINDEPKNNDSNKENQTTVKSNTKKGANSSFNKKIANKYYYQIHQENLNSIYDCGIICPTKYDHQRTQPDIQDKYNSYLLLFDNEIVYNDNGSKQILLEINLLADEHPNSLNYDGLYLFDTPLPVSRISKIVYSDKDYWVKLQGLVASDATSFIPEIISIYKPNINRKKVSLESIALEKKLDFSEKLNVFNKRLGALAYMKNANLYYGVFSNYSDNYFRALNELDSNFNPKYQINKEISFKKAMNTESVSDSKNDIYSDIQINKEYLETKLKEKKYSLDKLPKGPFSINKKDYLKAIEENYKEWFNVAFLAIYGDKSAASTASIQLKSEFASEVKNREKADALLALLGAYYGYKVIRPHDQIAVNSRELLTKEINTNTNIKFKMDSQLDYLTIETVYQKTFKDKVADKDFICTFAPKFNGNAQIAEIFNRYNRNKYFDCTKQNVYDVEYLRISKKNAKNVVIETVNENYEDKIIASKSLFSWVYAFFLEKGIVRFDSHIFVKKEELIKEIEKSEDKYIEKLDLERFDELLSIDIKYKR